MGFQLKKGASKFEQATAGKQPAVISKFEDIGEQETKFGLKSQCRIIYTLAEVGSGGQQKRISQTLTASLHEKSALSAVLTSIFGAVPDLFDADSIIGKQVLLNLGAVVKDGVERTRLYGVEAAPPGQNVQCPKVKASKKSVKAMRTPRTGTGAIAGRGRERFTLLRSNCGDYWKGIETSTWAEGKRV